MRVRGRSHQRGPAAAAAAVSELGDHLLVAPGYPGPDPVELAPREVAEDGSHPGRHGPAGAIRADEPCDSVPKSRLEGAPG